MNIIPLGDHCACAMILTELGLRKYAYPFDWYARIENDPTVSVFEMNMDILIRLLNTGNYTNARDELLQNQVSCKNQVLGNVYFAHENGTLSETNEKYERRFLRIYQHINQTEIPNMFLIILRTHILDAELFYSYVDVLSKNPNNKILLFSGIEQPFDMPHNVTYNYVTFNFNNGWSEDKAYRNKIKNILKTLISNKIEIFFNPN